jgi:hypothetical protein
MGGVVDGLVVLGGPQVVLREKAHPVVPLAIPGTYFVPSIEDSPAPKNHVPGFAGLTTRLAEEAAEASTAGPVLYVHMEFFGGQGIHDAMGWRDGIVAFGPLFTETLGEAAGGPYVSVPLAHDMAINAGLRWLGIPTTGRNDEYAEIGLDRFRWNADWLASITN